MGRPRHATAAWYQLLFTLMCSCVYAATPLVRNRTTQPHTPLSNPPIDPPVKCLPLVRVGVDALGLRLVSLAVGMRIVPIRRLAHDRWLDTTTPLSLATLIPLQRPTVRPNPMPTTGGLCAGYSAVVASVRRVNLMKAGIS